MQNKCQYFKYRTGNHETIEREYIYLIAHKGVESGIFSADIP